MAKNVLAALKRLLWIRIDASRETSDHGTPVRKAPAEMKFVSAVLYALVGLAFLGLGLRYIMSPELMPYHIEILDAEWETLAPAYRQLLLGLLKGFGIGSMGAGLATILLVAMSFANAPRWPTFVVSAFYSTGLIYVTSFALLSGATPIYVSYAMLGLVLVAGAIDFSRSRPTN